MTIRTASGAMGMAAAMLLALFAALLLATPAAAAGNQALTLTASATSVDPGNTITVTIAANPDVAVSGEQTTFNFDHTRFAVTDVQLGPDWTAGQFIIGVAPNNTEPLAIAAANADGHLRNIAGYYTPPTTVPSGVRTFAVITLQALANGGSSMFTLSSASGIDGAGAPVTTSASSTADVFVNGPISVGGIVETFTGDSGSSGLALWTIALAAAAAVALVGGLGLAGYRARGLSRG